MATPTKKVTKKPAPPAKTEAGTMPAPPGQPPQAMTPFEEMERYMERLFGSPFRGWLPSLWERPGLRDLMGREDLWHPRVDVIDRDDEVVVRAEVPGVKKDDLEVSLTDNAVTIKGSTRHEEKEEKGEYHRSETMRGTFSRIVTLPAEVDGNKARATFNDGVLELTMPKRAPAKRRRIPIK